MALENVSSTADAQTDSDYEKTTPELDSDALLLRFKEWWREDNPHCKLWHTDARLDFDFRAGEQWPEEDRQYMEDGQKRACLTFNRIDPIIDAVVGSEITNRQEVRYIPRQVGDQGVNDVLTEAARWFRDECDAEHEESNAFADAVTCGMGWTETRLDYDNNPNGDPSITRIDPLEMFWDHSAKQANLVDARRIYRVRREVPLNEAKNRWAVDMNGNAIMEDGDYDAGWASDAADDETPYEVHYPGDPLEHEGSEGKEERTVTLVQVQWFERQEFYRAMLADPMTGQQQTGELTPDQHLIASQRAAALGHFYRAVKQTRKCFYEAFVGGVVLNVRKVIAPSGKHATNYSFTAITGKWDRNKACFYGLVRGMRGPQTFANKWLSTAVEIMARASKGGLMLEEGAVADTDDFENSWATPGANAYFKPGAITGGKVQPKPATQFPTDFMAMTQFAITAIRDVSVNAETLGQQQQDQPAALEYQRRQSAVVMLAPLFDSLRRYRRIEGRVLLFLITEYLTDGRLIRIVGDEGEQYVPLVRAPGVTEYDVIVDDAPSSPSQKELVWNSMVTMMPMIQNMQPPPQVILALLDYSPLPASVVAKIKQALADASQGAPPPPPDPMTLILQEKQAEIQADQQKKAADIKAKRDGHTLDVAHQAALARINLHQAASLETIRVEGKQRELVINAEAKRREHEADAARRHAEALAGARVNGGGFSQL